MIPFEKLTHEIVRVRGRCKECERLHGTGQICPGCVDLKAAIVAIRPGIAPSGDAVAWGCEECYFLARSNQTTTPQAQHDWWSDTMCGGKNGCRATVASLYAHAEPDQLRALKSQRDVQNILLKKLHADLVACKATGAELAADNSKKAVRIAELEAEPVDVSGRCLGRCPCCGATDEADLSAFCHEHNPPIPMVHYTERRWESDASPV